MSIATFLFISLITGKSWSQLYSFNVVPENVRQSYAWGISDNFALTRNDLIRLAGAVYRLNSVGVSARESIEKMQSLSDNELKQTATANFLIEYVEIRESELTQKGKISHDFSKMFADEAAASPLRFKKNGEWYIRWFIHPLRVNRGSLKFLGSNPIKQDRFLAQLTESRSVIVMDRATGEYWSSKLSLPDSHGPYAQKAYPAEFAKNQLLASDNVARAYQENGLGESTFMNELHAVGIKIGDFSEGMGLRSLRSFRDGSYFVPYSAIYSYGLEKYAVRPVGQSREEFEARWLSVEPGNAAARLYYYLGLAVNSNHSQNSGLRLNPNRSVLGFQQRDHDYYLDRAHPKAKNLIPSIDAETVDSKLYVDFSMLNGFKFPSFYSGASYLIIIKNFFLSFEMSYHHLQGKKPPTSDISNRIFMPRTYGQEQISKGDYAAKMGEHYEYNPSPSPQWKAQQGALSEQTHQFHRCLNLFQ